MEEENLMNDFKEEVQPVSTLVNEPGISEVEESVITEPKTVEAILAEKGYDTDGKKVSEEVVVEVNEAVTLDDLNSKAPKESMRVIEFNDEESLPETFTISNVKLGKPLLVDESGTLIPPDKNSKGSFYRKAKLIVEVEELVNDSKIRTFIPSIFYSINDLGEMKKIPSIPKACADEYLEDSMKSELSKIRNRYCKSIGQDPKEISDVGFVKGLIGKKFKPVVKKGEHKNKKYITLRIGEFL